MYWVSIGKQWFVLGGTELLYGAIGNLYGMWSL